MKNFIRSLLAVAFIGLIAGPKLSIAADRWERIPGGEVKRKSGTAVPRQEKINAVSEMGWQWSGPFTASVVSTTATTINPSAKATNLTSGTGYQGPYRVVFVGSQQIQWQPTNLTTNPGVTYTASTLGLVAAANSIVNVGEEYGNLWPKTYVAINLSPTVSGSANNLTYWVLDQDW